MVLFCLPWLARTAIAAELPPLVAQRIDENVSVVAKVDLRNVALEPLAVKLKTAIEGDPEMATFADEIMADVASADALVESLAAAGATDGYLIIGLAEIQGGPMMLLPAPDEATAAQMASALTKAAPSMEKLIETHPSGLVVHYYTSPRSLAAASPERAAAFAELLVDGPAAQAVVMPSMPFRQVIGSALGQSATTLDTLAKTDPETPDLFLSLNAASQFEHVVLRIDAGEPNASATVTFPAPEPAQMAADGFEVLRNYLGNMRDGAALEPSPKLAASLTIDTEANVVGRDVHLTLKADKLDDEAAVVATMLRKMQDDRRFAASLENLRQIGMKITEYAGTNYGNLPQDLSILKVVARRGGWDAWLVNPRATGAGYAYVGEGKRTGGEGNNDAVVMYELVPAALAEQRIGVLYTSGRIDVVTLEQLRMIAETGKFEARTLDEG